MRLVYVDEAGLSNPEQEPFLVVAGLIVNADTLLNALENRLDRLVQKYIPQEHWSTFVFHATELFNGGGKVFRRDDPSFTLSKRLDIAAEITEIIRKNKLPLALGVVERAKFPRVTPFPDTYTAAQKTVAAHATAFMMCSMNVEHWMRRNTMNEVCLLVVEDNDQARKLIRETQNEYQNKRLVEEAGLDERARKHFPFRKIKEDPLFQPKKRSNVLQLADYCAYVFKKSLMEDRRYDRFANPLRSQIIIFPEFFVP